MKPSTLSLLIWLAGSCLFVFVISLIFVHAPAPFRRLGIFYAVFGFVCGIGMNWLKREQDLKGTPRVWVLAFGIVFTGGGNLGWSSFHELRTVRAEQSRENPEQLAMLNFLANTADDESKKEFEDLRREIEPTFGDYLAFRVSGISSWSAPWPLVFWLSELSIASGIATWMVARDPSTEHINTTEKADP